MRLAAAVLLASLLPAARLEAQTAALLPDEPAFTIRLFADAGLDWFNASRSFEAVFSQDNGPVYGGGAEVVAKQGWFVRVGAWRFEDDGQRALRLENQTFPLGIPLTVTILPVELNGGYRFRRRSKLVPYAGAGVSWHRYEETSQFADTAENVDERFTGYQVLGGVEFRLHRWFGVAGEVQYTSVPDAIGAGGLSEEFDEKDLGGTIVRVRVLIGR
jgi:opacity protein-like surface antigen